MHAKRFPGLTAVLAIVASAVCSPAMADSTLGSCDVNDVTTDLYGPANDCVGLFSGNIATSGAKSYTNYDPWTTGPFAGGGWAVLASDDDLLSSDNTWSLNAAGAEELIIVLKQADYWGAWYFNPVGDSGTWTTVKWNGSNEGNAYSHAFALVRGDVKVPEPATIGLLGLGLAAAGLVRRRRPRL